MSMSFSEKILAWYDKNKRDLPWRGTKNPYLIWLSEIMLQQTRIAQGIPYYLKFVEHFPKIEDLAMASEEEVLKLWQGLGYYSRARNLHATAKKVSNDMDGIFPNTYDKILKLKGIGDYTASAIASICFDQPHAVVDGNVYRVLARYFGVGEAINSTQGIRYFKKLANEVMNVDHIRDYNQGIMEFGSLQCTPKNPDCSTCPLNSGCKALQQDKVGQLPVKINKTKVRDRYFNYVVVLNKKSETLLQQREGKGIWQNLWEFPLIESDRKLSPDEVGKKIRSLMGLNAIERLSLYNEKKIVHKLSHQHLHTWFWIAETDEELCNGLPLDSLEKFPVPVLIADFIKAFKS